MQIESATGDFWGQGSLEKNKAEGIFCAKIQPQKGRTKPLKCLGQKV
jgi:hypothetical protein